jgi:hypothetical protein
MTTVPFALSVHSLVNSLGTDLAFAAIIGLAILILLYFAQARETATLRERLDDAAQWIETLESRLTQLQRTAPVPTAQRPGQQPQGAAGAPVQRPRPGQPASSRPGGAAIPAVASGPSRPMRGPLLGAPAGMAGPALAAATHLIPLSGSGSRSVVPAGGGEGEQEMGVGAAGGQATGGQTSAVGDETILAAPAPATAAAMANGHGQGSGGVAAPPAPRPAFAAGSAGPASAAGGPLRGPARSAGNGPGAPGASAAALAAGLGGSRPLPPLRGRPAPQASRARRLAPLLIGLAAVVVIVVALLILTGGSSTTATVHKSRAASARARHAKTVAVNPSTVTVAVLNGTSVTNLAHDVASRLGTDGYKEGTIATAADQTHSTTTVAYLPGHQADARAVAAVLNLKSSAVVPVDQQAMGVACPGSGTSGTSGASGTSGTPASSSSCGADVVVTVGSDLAGLASSTSGG